jgi:hypothetical protein
MHIKSTFFNDATEFAIAELVCRNAPTTTGVVVTAIALRDNDRVAMENIMFLLVL